MGVSVNAQINPNSSYVDAIRRIFAFPIIRFIKPWLWIDFIFNFSSLGKRFQKGTKILHSFTDSVKPLKISSNNKYNNTLKISGH
jgi:hypothetical protein